MKRVTEGDALATIMREGADAETVGLLGDLFESNHRASESTFQMLYESEKAAHERTMQRALDAEQQLRTARHRAAWLVGDLDTHDPWKES